METSIEIHAKFQHAERMHEQQLKKAYKAGQDNGYSYRDGDPSVKLITAEEYYQQTYKTQAQCHHQKKQSSSTEI